MNTCRDILAIDTAKVTRGGQSVMVNRIDEIVQTVCEKHQAA
jgi:hypothetical protein